MIIDYNVPDDPDKFRYRADDYCFNDQWTISFEAHPVVKKTPKGVILNVYGIPRFVRNGNGKRFAYEKKEWALNSLRIRRQHSLYYAQRDLDRAQRVLALIEGDRFKEERRDNFDETGGCHELQFDAA